MTLVNSTAISKLNDFTTKYLLEGIIGVIDKAIDLNENSQADLESHIAFLESPDASASMGVNKADIKVEDFKDRLGDLQEIKDVLVKLKAIEVAAFVKKVGVPYYKWNKTLSIEENVKAKRRIQKLRLTK
tara:strand:- start:216 stop:605 length:390 start_codon:yes stop_codon:yes gene_type:complete